MNPQAMMKQVQKLQNEMMKTQEEINNTEFEGKSSLVTVVVDGKKNLKSVKINLDELRNKYIELQDGVKSGIKDEEFVEFIHDRFTDLIDNDTYDSVQEKI